MTVRRIMERSYFTEWLDDKMVDAIQCSKHEVTDMGENSHFTWLLGTNSVWLLQIGNKILGFS